MIKHGAGLCPRSLAASSTEGAALFTGASVSRQREVTGRWSRHACARVTQAPADGSGSGEVRGVKLGLGLGNAAPGHGEDASARPHAVHNDLSTRRYGEPAAGVLISWQHHAFRRTYNCISSEAVHHRRVLCETQNLYMHYGPSSQLGASERSCLAGVVHQRRSQTTPSRPASGSSRGWLPGTQRAGVRRTGYTHAAMKKE